MVATKKSKVSSDIPERTEGTIHGGPRPPQLQTPLNTRRIILPTACWGPHTQPPRGPCPPLPGTRPTTCQNPTHHPRGTHSPGTLPTTRSTPPTAAGNPAHHPGGELPDHHPPGTPPTTSRGPTRRGPRPPRGLRPSTVGAMPFNPRRPRPTTRGDCGHHPRTLPTGRGDPAHGPRGPRPPPLATLADNGAAMGV